MQTEANSTVAKAERREGGEKATAMQTEADSTVAKAEHRGMRVSRKK